MNRKPIFDAVRHLLGRSFNTAEVTALDVFQHGNWSVRTLVLDGDAYVVVATFDAPTTGSYVVSIATEGSTVVVARRKPMWYTGSSSSM